MAEKSTFNQRRRRNAGYRAGAVIARGGSVISTGWNKDNPGGQKHELYEGRCIHAELDAVLKVNKNQLRGSTIYVFVLTRANNTAKSEPCVRCRKLLTDCGIKKIVYSEKDGTVVTVKVQNGSN